MGLHGMAWMLPWSKTIGLDPGSFVTAIKDDFDCFEAFTREPPKYFLGFEILGRQIGGFGHTILN